MVDQPTTANTVTSLCDRLLAISGRPYIEEHGVKAAYADFRSVHTELAAYVRTFDQYGFEADEEWNWIRTIFKSAKNLLRSISDLPRPHILICHTDRTEWAPTDPPWGPTVEGLFGRFRSTVPERPVATATSMDSDDDARGELVDQMMIERSEAETPPLNEHSDNWLLVGTKEFRDVCNVKTNSLKTMRSPSSGGCRHRNGLFGIDKVGRIWRRKSGSTKIYYFRPTL